MPRADVLLHQARQELAETQSPSRDARLLLQHVTGLSHAAFLADPDILISDVQTSAFLALVHRRARHEPVTRILGKREFYGRDFTVTPDVLDPRPDTEILLETALQLMLGLPAPRILDLGTGSGILPITLLAERADARATAVDISWAALAVTRTNAQALGVAERLQTVQSSWCENLSGQFDVILSNPPYIADGEIPNLEEEVRNFDPHLALAGGGDGLQCYRAIAATAAPHLAEGGKLAVEVGAGQSDAVTEIFASSGWPAVSSHRDLGGHMRCLVFGRASESV